jgi:hypothetical protein
VRVAEPGELDRLWALARVVRREAEYLAQTDGRLFGQVFDAERARTLPLTPELAERVDAFVARFGRLQDTLADKLLPALLRRKRGLNTLLTRVSSQTSTTGRSSANPTRQVVPSPGSMLAVRWLMRTTVPTTV